MLTTIGWAATILSVHDWLTFTAFVLLVMAQCFIAYIQHRNIPKSPALPPPKRRRKYARRADGLSAAR